MRRKHRFWRRLGRVLLAVLLLLGIGFLYLVIVSRVSPPDVKDKHALSWVRTREDSDFFSVQNDWFRHSPSGLYEMYIEGAPYDRGVANGKLAAELVVKQEDYFNEQINKMIPSKFYLHFLKYFVGWFNRDLDKHVTEEYKEEIYGISASASDRYAYIGTNYQRILNYHAAHDIGHALQNLALVGCTSFGTWGTSSADGSLIIGRNFDFYVGDHFAENKIVCFEKPDSGYRFASVTWAGFIGVVSGMNEKGLTVTINADKSRIPSGSATPVSLVAREILQYASTIPEALAIARRRKMFVSESFLVGSAVEHKAAIIEKTPDSIDVYDPGSTRIVCANHFQGEGLGASPLNREQVANSASDYRERRVRELLDADPKNTVAATAALLRDRRGLGGADIGLGNEKAVNQLIAHHSVIFQPEKGLIWVSTSPWQEGKYMCYDLSKVFALAGLKQDREIADTSRTIPADPFLDSASFAGFQRFRAYRQTLAAGGDVDPDSLVASNPNYYYAWTLAGNYLFRKKEYARAAEFYRGALAREVATKGEEEYIRRQIAAAEKKR